MTNDVAIQKCGDYDFATVYSTIKKLIELSPPPDVNGKTVLLKPNILSPKKVEDAVCTHPIVVGAAVKIFVELGAKKVLVGESPATANPMSAAKSIGMYDQVVRNGGEWVDFSGSFSVPCPKGKIVKTVEFATAFSESDIVVSLSKLKTHQFMLYTGAMKNLFGLIVGLKKAQSHYRFPDKKTFGAFLTDLNLAANAQYAIMDAVVSMEGKGGPGNGKPVSTGFLAASQNVLALDWVCSSIVGYNPYQIPNLKDALERKTWLSSPEQICVKGETIESVKPSHFEIVKDASSDVNLKKKLPNWVNRLVTFALVKTPSFDKKKCIHCGRCIEICPAHILDFVKQDENPLYVKMSDKTKCLHCFCCHEICPVEAIQLKRF